MLEQVGAQAGRGGSRCRILDPGDLRDEHPGCQPVTDLSRLRTDDVDDGVGEALAHIGEGQCPEGPAVEIGRPQLLGGWRRER